MYMYTVSSGYYLFNTDDFNLLSQVCMYVCMYVCKYYICTVYTYVSLQVL